MYFRTPLLGLALTLLASAAFAAEHKPNTLSAAEKKGGWKLLFDGQSLKGWRGYKTEAVGPMWKVEDGAIILRGEKSGDLMTTEQFGDFELSFDWKISAAGNSGVIYRIGLGDAASYRTGPEYQVLDNQKADDNKKANHLAGSLYDIGPAPDKDYTKPVGEWNQGKIVVKGWHVEHWLNGHKVANIDLASPAGKTALQESKFKTWEKFATLPRGHIALQEHGHVVSYRSIKIRELK